MRMHNGMRPQDIAILLKISSNNEVNWHLIQLSNALSISSPKIYFAKCCMFFNRSSISRRFNATYTLLGLFFIEFFDKKNLTNSRTKSIAEADNTEM